MEVNSHKPSGWCLHSKFAYGKVKKPTTQYRGPDCVEKFCKDIISEAKRLHSSYPEVPMLPLTSSQRDKHKKAKTCDICFKEFGDKGKVRDHVIIQELIEELHTLAVTYAIKFLTIYQLSFTISPAMTLTYS